MEIFLYYKSARSATWKILKIIKTLIILLCKHLISGICPLSQRESQCSQEKFDIPIKPLPLGEVACREALQRGCPFYRAKPDWFQRFALTERAFSQKYCIISFKLMILLYLTNPYSELLCTKLLFFTNKGSLFCKIFCDFST